MKYRVTLNGTPFTFDDGNTAISFAEIAKAHAEDDVTVRIDVKNDKDGDLD